MNPARIASALASLLAVLAPARAAEPPVAANPQFVQEVLSGKRTEANLGADWNVRPIKLAGDQELVLDKGVVITAKRGAYQGRGDSVFTARDVANLTLRGYGATVRMHKEDYIVGLVLQNLGWNRWYGPYEKAEWRMCLALRGCTNVQILGLTLRDSGGDGIYIDGGKQNPCRDIHIREVTCDNNYRQGISVISVDGLLVENSRFNNTWGTPPSSGVDIEPDDPEQKAKRIVFRNCRFEDNYGDGIEVYLTRQHDAADDVSILFEGCHVTSRRGSGIRVAKLADRRKGLVEFRRCTVENTEAPCTSSKPTISAFCARAAKCSAVQPP